MTPRELPLEACRLAMDRLEIEPAADSNGKTPVRILARSTQPVPSLFGPIHHDFQGMQYSLPLPLDYCHDDTEVIGAVESLSVDSQGLTARGFLVSIQPQDRAAEIAEKRKAGVPYQASIYLEPLAIEEVRPGAEALVNGQVAQGPALIVRQWLLRGIAICPYGRDPQTRADLALKAQRLATFPVPKWESSAMENRHEQPPVAQTDPRAEFAALLKRYVESFGPELGARWAAEGLTWEQALARRCEQLAERCSELESQLAEQRKVYEEQIAELKARLQAVPRGEQEPVSFCAEEAPVSEKARRLYPGLGKLAAYAASLQLPKHN